MKYKCKCSFHEIEYFVGKYPINCQIVDILDYLKEQLRDSKEVSHYVSERVKTHYYNKSGKKVSYTRTAHVEKCMSPETIIKKLLTMPKPYLSHYLFIIND